MGEKEDTIYEVVFSYRRTDKDKIKTQAVIGPVVVTAKTERTAIVKAVLKEGANLLKADLLTLDVKVRGF